MNECLDAASEGRWDVGEPVRCQRGKALAIKQHAWFQAFPSDVANSYAHTLLWGAARRP